MNVNMTTNFSGDIEITDVYEHWKIIVVSHYCSVFEITDGVADQFVDGFTSLSKAYNCVQNDLT